MNALMTLPVVAAVSVAAIAASTPPTYEATVLPQLDTTDDTFALTFTTPWAISNAGVVTGAFGGEEVFRSTMPECNRIMHAQITIDGRPLYLCDDFPEMCKEGRSRSPKVLGNTPVTIHQYVENCDAAIRRAEVAGATVVMPPQDMFGGDCYGAVTDLFGDSWSFATHIRDLTPEEITEASRKAFAGA